MIKIILNWLGSVLFASLKDAHFEIIATVGPFPAAY